MRVQRVAPLEVGDESWAVLGDDWRQVVPVEQFLSHLTDQRLREQLAAAHADLRAAGRHQAPAVVDLTSLDGARERCGPG